MINVMVCSVARSDFTILEPVLDALARDKMINLQIAVSGMHLSPHHGLTVGDIESRGFKVTERIETILSSDTPAGMAKSIGLGVLGFSEVFNRNRPHLLVLMGDRFEVFAAACAALPFGIPIAHIHGGELSEGAIDDSFRHSITKMSNIHFAATEEYRRRIIQMGEQPDRVFTSGAPAIDKISALTLPPMEDLFSALAIDPGQPPLLVTLHPTTRALGQTRADTEVFIAALEDFMRPVIVTAPNADSGGRMIRSMMEAAVSRHKDWHFVENLGTVNYYGLQKYAAAMVGNSSSGIIEAASFRLPVVNVGIRQKGRIAPKNVLHVPFDRKAIGVALDQACSTAFRESLVDLINPYGSGAAAETIVREIKRLVQKPDIIVKEFHNVSVGL